MSASKKALAKELHKQPKLKFRRKITTARFVNDVWGADIVDMASLTDQGYRYLLTIIDVLSRFAIVVPLQNKKAETVAKAFHSIFDKLKVKPKTIWTDRGSEFKEGQIGVNINYAFGAIKVGIIERLNKTLKHMMWYKMTKHHTEEWYDRLPKIVSKYNNTIHSSIGMKPQKAFFGGSEVEKVLLEMQHLRALKNKYKYDRESHSFNFNKKLNKQLFNIGDRVRIVNPPPKSGDMFKKGYRPRWSEEIFVIDKLYPAADGPVTYGVKRTVPLAGQRKGSVDKVVKQHYYNEELQKTQL